MPEVSLPPTVNLHLVAHCNYACRYCFARFESERKSPGLSDEQVSELLRGLAGAGVRRVTFAGGEPTLHPRLNARLRETAKVGLVASLVTNGSLIDDAWLARNGPYLRWITLSVDSVVRATADSIGRRSHGADVDHAAHVLAVAASVRRFNAVRPSARRIRLKLNVTVTGLNAAEDASAFVLACRPEKVKFLQMLVVAGENDEEAQLVCEENAFAAYVERSRPPEGSGIQTVVEDNEAMDGSYAMIDPAGRFYQRMDGRYVRSRPIPEVGIEAAWKEIGGFSAEKFVTRGGAYEPGIPADGNRPHWIAIEGIDGSGKSTVASLVAKSIGATVMRNPPDSLATGRAFADSLGARERRAWYLAANREAARQACDLLDSGRPVVMDRSTASTIVFGAAEQGRVARADEWSPDIPRPDHLFLLEVAEPERLRRLIARGDRLTEEERMLCEDGPFRDRVRAGYVALGAHVVRADAKPDEIAGRILAIMQSGCH